MSLPAENKNKNSVLLRYAGLATQFFVSIGIGIFVGVKLDRWLHLKIPILVWVLPLFIIIVIILKLIKDTSNKT